MESHQIPMVPLLIIILYPIKNTILAMLPIHQQALKQCQLNAAPLGACRVGASSTAASAAQGASN